MTLPRYLPIVSSHLQLSQLQVVTSTVIFRAQCTTEFNRALATNVRTNNLVTDHKLVLAIRDPIQLDSLKELPSAYVAVHLSVKVAAFVAKSHLKPSLPIYSCAVHNLQELEVAEQLQPRCVLVSPVFKTKDYSDHQLLGIEGFSQLARQTQIPVFAMGGVKLADYHKLKAAGACGIAGIRTFL